MRASDIADQIAVVLPQLVDDFTDSITVSSLTRSGTIATVNTTSAHGLTVGKQVNITGAKTPIVISSLTRSGIIGAIVTASDHDLTESEGATVEITGATESEFNGTFTIISVQNRRNITFQMPDAGAVTATGSPLLLNGASVFQSYNGLKQVVGVPSATSFEFDVADSLFTPAAGTIVAKTSPRIGTAVSFDRLIDAYTSQPQDSAWLFVVLGDSVASKNRSIDTDSTDNIQPGQFFNQRLIQTVNLYVFIPTKNEISGAKARDRCEELLSPICRSVLTAKFPSLVENDNNPLMLSGHGFEAYNTAFYVHSYTFEATMQLGASDVYAPGDDVAFRDIGLTMGSDIGSGTFNTDIDLDDDPL